MFEVYTIVKMKNEVSFITRGRLYFQSELGKIALSKGYWLESLDGDLGSNHWQNGAKWHGRPPTTAMRGPFPARKAAFIKYNQASTHVSTQIHTLL
jgi:hypothetical protein